MGRLDPVEPDEFGHYPTPWTERGGVLAMRVAVGLVTRLIFWLAFFFIVGNAVAQFIHDKDWGMAVASAVFFPVTLIVYPFVHHARDVSLWPVGPQDNVTAVLIGALVVAFVAHLLSTTVGGMDPVE